MPCAKREHGHDPETGSGNDGNRRQTAHAHQQRDQGAGHNQFPFRAEDMGVAVQRLMNREAVYSYDRPGKGEDTVHDAGRESDEGNAEDDG